MTIHVPTVTCPIQGPAGPPGTPGTRGVPGISSSQGIPGRDGRDGIKCDVVHPGQKGEPVIRSPVNTARSYNTATRSKSRKLKCPSHVNLIDPSNLRQY